MQDNRLKEPVKLKITIENANEKKSIIVEAILNYVVDYFEDDETICSYFYENSELARKKKNLIMYLDFKNSVINIEYDDDMECSVPIVVEEFVQDNFNVYVKYLINGEAFIYKIEVID